jgi:hypothetical protein
VRIAGGSRQKFAATPHYLSKIKVRQSRCPSPSLLCSSVGTCTNFQRPVISFLFAVSPQPKGLQLGHRKYAGNVQPRTTVAVLGAGALGTRAFGWLASMGAAFALLILNISCWCSMSILRQFGLIAMARNFVCSIRCPAAPFNTDRGHLPTRRLQVRTETLELRVRPRNITSSLCFEYLVHGRHQGAGRR